MDKKKVRDYMTYDVITIPAEGTCREVMEKIQTTGHDGFPVVKDKEVVGYIAARDLLFVSPSTEVEKVMSRHLIVADPDMSINDAARVIFRSGIQKLPVVDAENRLLGIISNTDMIRSPCRRDQLFLRRAGAPNLPGESSPLPQRREAHSY